MGYRIEYTQDQAIRRPAKWPEAMRHSLLLGCTAGILLGLWFFFPELGETLRQLLPVTEQVDSLIASLKSGVDFGEAVGAFCQELLHG